MLNTVLNHATNPLVVKKFGGTSMGSIERIRGVAQIIVESLNKESTVVVVSAMSGQTNKLIEMGFEMSAEPKPEALDFLLASGEQVSCALLSMALNDLGVNSAPLLGFQAGILTDPHSTAAKILTIDGDKLHSLVKKGIVPVIAGFQGIAEKDGHSQITTLGRGGSDTSAVAVAIAMKASRCDIFTDVDGIFTGDPRVIPNAKHIETMSFEEMMELASLGAKVLHMRSVELAAKYKMPLRVLSTFNPHFKGSLLMDSREILESPVVSAVTADQPESLLAIRVAENQARFPSHFFKPLADAGINVDVIVKSSPDNQSTSTISFTVPRLQAAKARELLSRDQAWIEKESVVKISIVGIGMRTHSGVASKMFETLEKENIPIYLISTSEIKVSVLIEENHKNLALQSIHKAFDLHI
jgi:aspartate kinase